MAPAAAVASLEDLLDQTAGDPDADPAERVASLRALRSDLSALMGIADRYIADQELRREGAAFGRVRQFMGARAEANARGELLDRGEASPEGLDSAGFMSHDELDRRTADGSIEEAILGLPLSLEEWTPAALAARQKLHPDWNWKNKVEAPTPEVPEKSFKTRTRELDTRVADAVARSSGQASPGTTKPVRAVRDTGPVPDAAAPLNPAGKVSQKRLLAAAKGALSQPSTVDTYAQTGADGKRVYDKSRQALHQKIINSALEGIPSQRNPRVMFMGGGYASGKGTVRRQLEAQGKVPENALTLDPDQIKAQLPEFQHMVRNGDPEANLATYEEAWDVAQALQHEAMKRKVHTVVDGLSNTSPEDMLNRVKAFKDAGYKHAEAHYVNIPTDEAVKRANNRAVNSTRPENRRVIPESLMRATHRDVSAALPGIIDGSRKPGEGLDAVHVHDTTEKSAKPLYSMVNGKEKVHDEAGYQEALDKAHEEVEGVDSPARADTQAALEEVEKLGLNEWPKPGAVANAVLHGHADTQSLHAAPGQVSPGTAGAVYSDDRKPVHDQIVGSALGSAVEELLGGDHAITQKLHGGGTLSDEEKDTIRQAASAARGGENPDALFMGGGSASGKSSALAQAPELVPHAAVHIDPDAFKEQLPEYQQMVGQNERYAAAGVHEESADLAKRVQSEARDLGLNMLIDGTGDSKAAKRDEQGNVTEPGKFAKKLIDADKAGYNVKSLYVTVPTNTAVVRSVRRAQETGRFVPVPEVRNQHRNVSANFPEIAALPFVKDMKVFDTSGNAPEQIYHGAGGQGEADDPEAHKAFLDKANEPPA